MTTIGVLSGQWRATVSPTGSVEPWDGSAPLDWYVAADDRWYVPQAEPTIRQRLIDGTPVVETRLKVPGGDAIERVWCVADHGGLTVVEIENDSSLSFAVAFDRHDLLSARPPTDVPIQGIDLPESSIVFPVGHRSTIRVALRHESPSAGSLPDRVPPASQVARGWTSVLDRAGRVVVPDDIGERVSRQRAELLLAGPADPVDDPTGFLLDAGELIRLGEQPEPWVADVAEAVTAVARHGSGWDATAALDAAAIVLHRAGEDRALSDLQRLRPAASAPLAAEPSGHRWLAWREQTLARAQGDGTGDLLAGGLPPSWLGASIEVYQLPIGPATTVSYALRWHGERPAILWETHGPIVPLTASVIAPQWSTAEPRGEALWPPPPAPPAASPPSNVSFS